MGGHRSGNGVFSRRWEVNKPTTTLSIITTQFQTTPFIVQNVAYVSTSSLSHRQGTSKNYTGNKQLIWENFMFYAYEEVERYSTF